jgi:hypothetical protein
MFVSEGIRNIGESMIDNPHDWRQGNYSFSHVKRPELDIWTANGALFINIGGNSCLGLFEKFYLSKCIKKSLANSLRTMPKIEPACTK